MYNHPEVYCIWCTDDLPSTDIELVSLSVCPPRRVASQRPSSITASSTRSLEQKPANPMSAHAILEKDTPPLSELVSTKPALQKLAIQTTLDARKELTRQKARQFGFRNVQ